MRTSCHGQERKVKETEEKSEEQFDANKKHANEKHECSKDYKEKDFLPQPIITEEYPSFKQQVQPTYRPVAFTPPTTHESPRQAQSNGSDYSSPAAEVQSVEVEAQYLSAEGETQVQSVEGEAQYLRNESDGDAQDHYAIDLAVNQ